MKALKLLFLILVFALWPVAAFSGGSQDGGTDTSTADDAMTDDGTDDSADDLSGTETIGDDESDEVLGTGDEPGDVPGDEGDDDDSDVEVEGSTSDVENNEPGGGDQGLSQAPPETDDAITEGDIESLDNMGADGTAATAADDALGAGDMDEIAVLETTGANRLRFSKVDGYDFGNGSVSDLVINQDGSIQYVVVDLDDSEGEFLVPPAMITFETAENGIRPTLNLTDAGTLTQVQGETESASAGAVFASDLVDYEVLGSGNEKVGDIEDVVIDLESGSIAYLAIAEGGFLGIGENLVAVSTDSVQINPQDGTVVVNLSADELKSMTFEPDSWPLDAQVGVEADATLGAEDTGMTDTTGTGDTMTDDAATDTTATDTETDATGTVAQ